MEETEDSEGGVGETNSETEVRREQRQAGNERVSHVKLV